MLGNGGRRGRLAPADFLLDVAEHRLVRLSHQVLADESDELPSPWRNLSLADIKSRRGVSTAYPATTTFFAFWKSHFPSRV